MRAAQGAPPAGRGQAFGLVTSATSCWLGGLWADALGEKYDDRTSGIEARCNDTLRTMNTNARQERRRAGADRGGGDARRAPPGVWLAYLSDAAKSAGHPVPADVKPLPHRETRAWTGVLEGFADKLRAEPAFAAPDTTLGHVVTGVVARLDDEYKTAPSLERAKQR